VTAMHRELVIAILVGQVLSAIFSTVTMFSSPATMEELVHVRRR